VVIIIVVVVVVLIAVPGLPTRATGPTETCLDVPKKL